MKPRGKQPPCGELRQNQVITTFGPGAMVDLPDQSILIGGLEYWTGAMHRVYEERLSGWLSDKLGVEDLALYQPPVDEEDLHGARAGITSFLFPTWFLGQVDRVHEEGDRQYRTRPLLPYSRLVKGGYLTEERKVVPVVPIRFVQACVKGHISDINWYAFVRDDFKARPVGQLWLDEGGAGNDFSEIFVRCEMTGKRRPLSKAMVLDGSVLGTCAGRQPWLGPKVYEKCRSPNRLLTRSASNAYFSQTMSAIAIPDSDQAMREAVDLVYDDFLQYAESAEDVGRERRKQKVFCALEGFADRAVWAEVQRRKGGQAPQTRGIKQVEIETLLSQSGTMGEDVPDGDFFARAHPRDRLGPALLQRVRRIVLVHRLREVIAQVGFSRFEAALPDITGELSLDVELAPLARDTTWLPAVENRGEGVFIAFDEDAISTWLKQPAVKDRGRQLEAGFDAWKVRRKVKDPKFKFPGLPYIMLHSLSHLLINAVALECGYAASAIRERIYACRAGHGILLYTGGTGTEGTLGGLVDVGRSMEHHLARALDRGRLCSNDPICAQHDPASHHEERYLHGAACHGCLLIAETSCERRNEQLDRALVVPTVATAEAAFFPEDCLGELIASGAQDDGEMHHG